MLKDKAELLCDDRMIIRKHSDGFKIYGTWSHGDVPEVSANSAALSAILFLEKSNDNCLMPLNDKKEIIKQLIGCIIRPFVTAEWWQKILGLVDIIASEIPCYVLRFDRSSRVIDVLRQL